MEENGLREKLYRRPRKIRKGRVALVGFILLSAALASGAYFFYEDILMLRFPVASEVEEEELSKVYNYYVFEKDDVFWTTKWADGEREYDLKFRNYPEDLENISLEGSLDRRFDNNTIFLTIDASNSTSKTKETGQLRLSVISVSTMLSEIYGRDVVAACTSNLSGVCEDYPVVSCEDEDAAVIHFKNASEPKVVLDGNCVTIEGSGEGFSKASELLIYKWLGIIK